MSLRWRLSPLQLRIVWTELQLGDLPSPLQARQEPGPQEHAGGDVALGPLAPDALIRAVVGQLPPARPGRTPQVRITALHARAEEPEESGMVLARPGGQDDQGPEQVFRELVEAPHTAMGQIGANIRDHAGRVHRSPVLRWFDNPGDGRYVLVPDPRQARQVVTLAPVDASQLGRRLLELQPAPSPS